MKIKFSYYSPESRIKHIPMTFERDVPVVPRLGERIIVHSDSGSLQFEVKQVLHVYENRGNYQGKDYNPEGVYVTLLIIDREQSYAEFQDFLKASGCS